MSVGQSTVEAQRRGTVAEVSWKWQDSTKTLLNKPCGLPGALGTVKAAQNRELTSSARYQPAQLQGICSALSSPLLEPWGECGYLTDVFTQHSTGQGGRDHSESWGPTSLLEQGHPEHMAQDGVQMVLEYLQ